MAPPQADESEKARYGISPAAYLARAKDALQPAKPAFLFYAAFELRCCIEARQAEYVEALQAFRGTKIKPWHLTENGRRIRRQSTARSIAAVSYILNGEVIAATYHTPVTDKLLSFGEKLGALLHSQRSYREPADNWWVDTRATLIEGYRMAWLACQGDSHVPPLWNATTKAIHPVLLEQNARNERLFDIVATLVGREVTVTIDYPDEPPADWKCDL